MKTSKYAVIVACLALAATGCGSSGKGGNTPNTSGNTSGGTGAQQGADSGGTGQGTGGPGGSGKVAAVSGSTAQVQNQAGQVAVAWTARTTFTQEIATKASALSVGDCVMVMPARSSSSGSGNNSGDTSGSATDGPVAAGTVRIVAPVAGSCTAGMRVDGGPRNGTPPTPSEGAKAGDEREDGAPRQAMMGAFGKVTAVTGSGFTVESVQPGSSGDTSTTSTRVTTSTDTVWTATRKATSNAVTVGRCVTSTGRADSTGAIKAVSITVSSPVNGECAVEFGGRRSLGIGGPREQPAARPGRHEEYDDDADQTAPSHVARPQPS